LIVSLPAPLVGLTLYMQDDGIGVSTVQVDGEQPEGHTLRRNEPRPPLAVKELLAGLREKEHATGGGKFDPVMVSPTVLRRTVSKGAAVPLVSVIFEQGPEPMSYDRLPGPETCCCVKVTVLPYGTNALPKENVTRAWPLAGMKKPWV
jgi:hypothetical protein